MLPATRHKWTRPAITPANHVSTRFPYPGRMEGWVDLGNLIAARPVIEPTTAWSQVRRPNRYANESPKHQLLQLFLHHSILVFLCHTFWRNIHGVTSNADGKKNSPLNTSRKRYKIRTPFCEALIGLKVIHSEVHNRKPSSFLWQRVEVGRTRRWRNGADPRWRRTRSNEDVLGWANERSERVCVDD